MQDRAQAAQEAQEGCIEMLAYSGREPEAVVRVRTDTGISLVSYNPGTSALLSMSRGANPLTVRQIEAGLRFEADHLVGSMSQSNALTIMKHLQASLPASAKDMERKAFGHVMRSAGHASAPRDYAAAKLTAAYRREWIRKQMSRVSFTLIEMLITYDKTTSEIAEMLGMDRRFVTPRIREALSELAACYEAFDALEGKSPEYPNIKLAA